MSLTLRIAAFALVGLGTTLSAHSKDDSASPADATALVKKGVVFVKANGKDKGYAEISNKQGAFIDRGLYRVAYGLDGVVRAHDANERMIGKSQLELKDVEGKAFVKERMELAQTKATFWQDYKFMNPVSKAVEPKNMYCEKVEDYLVCGGVYK